MAYYQDHSPFLKTKNATQPNDRPNGVPPNKYYENEWEFTSSLLKINEGKYKKKLDNSFKYRGINHSNKIYEVKTTSIDKINFFRTVVFRKNE